ncbi:MAG: ribosome-associated translation inhibitor RaiA [Taibaiella sp.]|nr:ribosome-associated translation inhibitor RaiA [Taibaiella sp.]
MDIIIQSLGFKASDSLENHINQKLEKIASHTDTAIRANVTLFKGPASEPENSMCEIRLEVPGNDHFVKKHADTFERAVSEAAIALEHVVQKIKDKAIASRHANDNGALAG